MEEGVKGAVPAQVQNSPSEQLIPKSRLDEIIAERNRLREERNLQDRTVQTLTQLLQRGNAPRAQAPQEHPYVKKLREEGRHEEAALYIQQQRELQQLRQTQAALVDDNDRQAFLYKYGKRGGEDKLAEVERIIEAERQQGNFKVTREGAFLWLLGNERLMKDERAESHAITQQQQQVPQQVPAQRAEAPEDVPSMDPSDIATVRRSGASDSWIEKSRDERIKDLENIEF